MKLTQFLSLEYIQQGVLLSSKKRVLELIGKLVADIANAQSTQTENTVCPLECFSNLFKREKLGSTALNNGVALPHTKLPQNNHITIKQPIAVFLQLAKPIDFEAEDHKEVDLVYAILFPEEHCEQYRGGLMNIAHQLSDKVLLKQLRAATSIEEIWSIFSYADQQAETQLEQKMD
ncbi:PTS sugar transporter subunit IIA [Vespertiliibacter pulmonis]|nr:PTS sugar transporter subunit IIA [Vespertiliibacter pulmonis]QLB21613.1 PTS sugar transporter subunit IIA [Vespertiliibacter pulmonis]